MQILSLDLFAYCVFELADLLETPSLEYRWVNLSQQQLLSYMPFEAQYDLWKGHHQRRTQYSPRLSEMGQA